MATCPYCGSENRDGVWVCGHCGEIVAAASVGSDASAASPYRAAGPSIPPSDATTPVNGPVPKSAGAGVNARSSGSRAVFVALVAGAVAVVAIVAVWFFVLRGGSGDVTPYLGTWRMQIPAGAAAGIPEMEFAIGENGDGAGVTMITQGQAVGPYRAQVEDGRLVMTFETTDDADEQQKAAAEMMRSAFGAVIEDFQWVFAPGTAAETLSLSFEGDLKGAGDLSSLGEQAVTLIRVDQTL